MKLRAVLLLGVALLVGLATGVALWRPTQPPLPDADLGLDADLPVPPVPPRIAQGADYEKCLDMIATDPAGAANFADAWEATGGGEAATHCHGLALVAQGQPGQGGAMLQKLADTSHAPPVARATVYGEANQAFLMAGDAVHALATATAAIALSPDDPDLLVDHAVTEARLGRYQDAVDDLDRTIDIDRRRADALVFRGSAWRHLGQIDLADDDIERALAVDPRNADAFLERGILREKTGDLAGARADWQRVQAVAPDTPVADFAKQNITLLDQGPLPARPDPVQPAVTKATAPRPHRRTPGRARRLQQP